jgi:hypothetical protein
VQAFEDESREIWWPRYFSFLSGLPESGRKRRAIVLVQAYVDDSGGPGQGTVFVFSAMIGSSLAWTRFSDHWKQCLDETPSIQYFKMREAASLQGQFRGFSVKERDDKLEILCKIIATGRLMELHCIVKLKDFDVTLRRHSIGPMTHPYFYPFYATVMGIGYQLLEWQQKEPFELFFDEHVIFGPRVKAWYPVVRATFEDQLRAITPVEPFFRSDIEVLPLQAADLTAWLHRRENNEGVGEFKWMEKALFGLAPSEYSNRFTLDRMKAIVDQSYAYTPEVLAQQTAVIEAYKETFDDDWPPKKKRKLPRGKKQ